MRYLKLLFFFTFIPVALVIAVNYVVDPIAIYHRQAEESRNLSRPAIGSYLIIHKAYAVDDAQADVLLLGHSRVNEGLNPRCAALPGKTYNLAMSGTNVYENWRALQSASASHLPKLVIIGLDPPFFNPVDHHPQFSEQRMRVQADGRTTFLRGWEDLPGTLASLGVFNASLTTLRAPASPVINFRDGYQPMIQSAPVDVILAWLAALQAHPPWPLFDPNGNSLSIDSFHRLAQFCAQNHIRLLGFIHPNHCVMTDSCTQQWDVYARWMKIVTDTFQDTPQLDGELWDFSGYNEITTEPMPKPTDAVSHLRFYWEPSHYRENVGAMVLNRMLLHKGPEFFGQKVTTATLPADLERLQREKEAWHASGQVAPVGIIPPDSELVSPP